MWLISRMDPIKYIFEKLALTGKISCWQMLLSEFDIVFVTRKAIKGKAIVDYLADQLLNDPELSESLFPDKDVMALGPEPDSVNHGVGSFILMESPILIEMEWEQSLFPPMAMEDANKNIKKVLVKIIDTYKNWHEYLLFALYAYLTSVRTSTGVTPYSLVYGMEAVLPVEVEIPSLRILFQTKLSEPECAQSRYEQLNMIDEKHMTAMCHGQLYQRRIEQAINKKVRLRVFEKGDLVLQKSN
ncbi:uncharacterized protein LOC142605900 [Castanea sativa]|uniref:uncharacterized protein LOC142605900 n=1 Tax=Castanea sativa TaxID=21020 RepID=UPI003F650B04